MILRSTPPVSHQQKKLDNSDASNEKTTLLKRDLIRSSEMENAFSLKLYPCYSIIAIGLYLLFNYPQAKTPIVLLSFDLAALIIYVLYSYLERRLLHLPSEKFYEYLTFYRKQEFYLFRIFTTQQVIVFIVFLATGA
jgi:hypothetical protein